MGLAERIAGFFKARREPKLTYKDVHPSGLPTNPTAWRSVVKNKVFDGEKSFASIGPVVNYILQDKALRLRSWKAYVDSDIAQTALNTLSRWVIGRGLKLQIEPMTDFLSRKFKIQVDQEEMRKEIEPMWKLTTESKSIHYHGEESLSQIALGLYNTTRVSGDALTILRVKDNRITVEYIDGMHIASPIDQKYQGRRIINGIEYDSEGQVVAYHVRKQLENGTIGNDRIAAYNSGRRVAFMVYGLRYKNDYNRGIPLITAVMETIAKLDRYKEATVASAEEVAKIAWQVVHQSYSSGEDPAADMIAAMYDSEREGDNTPVDQLGQQLANEVVATMDKMTFNNPVGAELKPMQTGTKDLYFSDFFNNNADVVYACLQVPPEVARSKYDSNYSASRGAMKDWENKILLDRDYFIEDFYKRVFDFWFDVAVLSDLIDVEGYLKMIQNNNTLAMDAYRYCSFTGVLVPHVDPLKEVKAVREMLGPNAAHVNLTTVRKATHQLEGGDSAANMKIFAEEMAQAEELGIIPEVEESSPETDPPQE
jgi:hypothetical protein